MSGINIIVTNSPLTPNSSPVESQMTRVYKNSGKCLKQLRRRRSETMVELRKQKKDTEAHRRRHIQVFDLWSDCEDTDEDQELIDLNAQQIIDLLKKVNICEVPAKYLRHLRKSISTQPQLQSTDNQPLLDQLMSDDLIIKLMHCISSDTCLMDVLYEVVALMTHLCSAHRQHIQVLVKNCIVKHFLSLLSYDNLRIIEQSILGLTYIWKFCPEMNEVLKSSQFLNILVGLIDSESSVSPSKIDNRIGLVRALSWALLNICQNQDPNGYRLSMAFIPYFVKLLKYNDSEVRINVLKALSIATERLPSVPNEENSPALKMVESVVSDVSLFSLIIDCLSNGKQEVLLNAIQVIGNIVSWGESFTQIIIQAKALQNFGSILNHSNANVQREGAFTIANITAGNLFQIQSVIDANLIPVIVELLYLGDYKTQVEASHVLLNISTLGSYSQIQYILNADNSVLGMDVIDAMVTLMTSTDATVLNICLDFVNNLLNFAKKAKLINLVIRRCNSSALSYHLDRLQTHRNTDIAILATNIIDEFFSRDLSFEEDIGFNTSFSFDEKEMETNISF